MIKASVKDVNVNLDIHNQGHFNATSVHIFKQFLAQVHPTLFLNAVFYKY